MSCGSSTCNANGRGSVGGTIDGPAGRAIARVSLSAIGAAPGSSIAFGRPSLAGLGASGTASYTVPEATVTLSLRQGETVVAAGPANLSDDTSTFSGSLDLAGVPAGSYELVATACYAGDCASTTTPIVV